MRLLSRIDPIPVRRDSSLRTRLLLFALLLACWASSVHAACCGGSWAQPSAAGPGARYGHAMAYDATHGKIVLFGGRGPSGLLGDTWEWDGTAWALKSTSGPSPRYLSAMAYDGVSGGVLLFGGSAGNGEQGDTWIWDGSTWTQRPPLVGVSGPSPRQSHALAYDSARRRVVLFGGLAGSTRVGDTWTWNGFAWLQMAATGPSSRSGHAMAYDSRRARTVLFGGADTGGLRGDTWEWTGGAWSLAAAAGGPSPRNRPAMAFDGCGRVLLFGGIVADTSAPGGSWAWDGNAWSSIGGTGPAGRLHHTMALDEQLGRVVLFGGAPDSNSLQSDLWQWTKTGTDASPWITQQPGNQVVIATAPAPFNVAAVGAGPLTYQWRRNGSSLGNGGAVSGAASPSLLVNPAAGGAGLYDVVVTNACGSARSLPATLTFRVPGSCVQPPAGMIAWYPLDESSGAVAHDTKGGRDGAVQGGAAFAPGQVGKALTFDGVDDYVRVPKPPLNLGNAFSIDAWVYPTDPRAMVVAGKLAPSVFSERGFILELNQTFLTFWWDCGDVVCKSGALSPQNAVPLNQWSHVAVTVDRTVPPDAIGIRLYVNGQQVSQTIIDTPGDVNGDADLLIGRGPDHWSEPELFKGMIDEVEIFDRALSAAELQALYQAGAAGKCKLACDSLYAIDFTAALPFVSKLYTLDPATGSVKSTVGVTGIGSTLGIDLAPDGFLYAVTTAGAASNPNSLYKIDPASGAAQLVGKLLLPGGVIEGDLAFDGSGTLYGISMGDLFKVSLATGKATLVGTVPGGLRDISYLAFNSLNNSLYAIDNGPTSSSPSTLLRLDPANAQILASKPLSKLGAWGGMAFEPGTGVFYLADSGPGGTNTMYTLNPGTGALSPVGPTNLAPGLSGIAFCRKSSCVPPPSGLVAWYPLDEASGTVAKDLSAGNNPGTYLNGPVSISGEVSLGRRFDGINDYVQAPSRPWLNLANFSIDAWVKVDKAADGKGVRVVAEKRSGSPLRGYSLFLYNRRPGLQLADAAGYDNYVALPAVPADGRWHLVAVTVRRAQANGGTWYIDGAPVGTFNPTNHPGSLANSSPLRIGSLTLGVTSVFKGGLDEVEIFNRALSAQEVAALFKAGPAGKCK